MEIDNQKLSKQQNEIVNNLYNTNKDVVLQAINTLRNNGGDYGIIPLVNTFFDTQHKEIRNEIANLFSDIKDNKVACHIYNGLEKYHKEEHLSLFLTSLWQSNVCFEKIFLFVTFLISGNNQIALEAFSIIEQNINNIDNNEKEKSLKFLQENLNKLDDFKLSLAKDLLLIISD